MLRRLSIAAPLSLMAAVACSDGPTPPPPDPITVAMQHLGAAFTSGTPRSDFAWYAIAALQHGADLTQFTVDVDGQARAFDGVAMGIIYDDEDGAGGPVYRDSLVVLVGWRGTGAREMVATAHLSDNFPYESPTAELLHEPGRRAPRPVPDRADLRGGMVRPAAIRPAAMFDMGDLTLHYLWYLTDASVWIDSLVRTVDANLTYGSLPCTTRILSLPTGYQFDSEGFPCRQGSFRQAMDVRLWPEVDASGAPMAQGRFDLVMRPAEYALPNFLDLLQ